VEIACVKIGGHAILVQLGDRLDLWQPSQSLVSYCANLWSNFTWKVARLEEPFPGLAVLRG